MVSYGHGTEHRPLAVCITLFDRIFDLQVLQVRQVFVRQVKQVRIMRIMNNTEEYTKMHWKKIVVELMKYLVAALAGALGVTATGCASCPLFIF